MVMNRHRWGGLHGAPLSSIAMDTDWDAVRNAQHKPFLYKFGLKPEIVDENLVIHATQLLFLTKRQIEHAFTGYDFVRNLLNTFKVCGHHSRFKQYLLGAIQSLFRDDHLPNTGSGTSLQQCRDCKTCFCLEVVCHGDWSGSASTKPESHVWDVPADGLELTMHSWMLLGDCEHVLSTLWLNIAEQRGQRITSPYANHFAASTFDRIVLPKVREQHSQMPLCHLAAIQHPSLLPAIDRALALENDPFETSITSLAQSSEQRNSRLMRVIWSIWSRNLSVAYGRGTAIRSFHSRGPSLCELP